jgi:hypothetical protein
MEKMNVGSLAELVVMAERLGLSAAVALGGRGPSPQEQDEGMAFF